MLSDQSGTYRAKLGLNETGQPALYLLDQNGGIRAALGAGATTTPDGKTTSYPESSLLLFGPDGTVIWRVPYP